MAARTKLSAQELYQKKERFYLRNFISLMLEGFTFSFALAMFSPENVLPVYVASLSDKAIYIALISALYYGFSYGCTVFSCVLGINAKSPKWISVIVCFLQRVGFFYNFSIHLFGRRKYGGGHCAVLCLFCNLFCQRRHVEPAVCPDGGHFHPQKCGHVLRRL